MSPETIHLKAKIIIVDDDILVLQTIKDILLENYDVVIIQNPIEALKMLNNEDFDIIIADYKMPKLSGITLIRGAKQIKSDILPIVITGFANKEIALEALKNGAYDFIEKPIIPEILLASVSRAWENIKVLNDNKSLIKKIKSYNEKLEENNLNLARKNEELNYQYNELQKAQSEVHRSALKAGMAEVATNILHNVGNILNSVNVTTSYLNENIKNSKIQILFNVITLINENAHQLPYYFSQDPKGKIIPSLLLELKDALIEENKNNLYEINRLMTNVEHIKSIITFQQNYATQPLKKEEFTLNSLIEDAVTILESELKNSAIQIIFDWNNNISIVLPKHKLLHVIINLLRNAKDSLIESKNSNKIIKIIASDKPLKITIEDNGVGIAKENLNKLFSHGYTTKKTGHGFGLHSCVLTIKDLGSDITAESDGIGQGAKFTITLPDGI